MARARQRAHSDAPASPPSAWRTKRERRAARRAAHGKARRGTGSDWATRTGRGRASRSPLVPPPTRRLGQGRAVAISGTARGATDHDCHCSSESHHRVTACAPGHGPGHRNRRTFAQNALLICLVRPFPGGRRGRALHLKLCIRFARATSETTKDTRAQSRAAAKATIRLLSNATTLTFTAYRDSDHCRPG